MITATLAMNSISMASTTASRASAVLNETDTCVYRELLPLPGLRHPLACSWVRQGSGPGRVLPDACVDIVWRRGQGAIVAGPDTRPWHSRTEPGEPIFGVRFLPARADPRSAYRCRSFGTAGSRSPSSTWTRASNEADPLVVPQLLAAAAARLVTSGPPDRAVQAAINRLRDPRERVEALAAHLGFSERQLRRRFLASVGCGPKTVQRVLRLQRFLGGERHELARAAHDAGYADQAHFARECLRLTGLSPRRLR